MKFEITEEELVNCTAFVHNQNDFKQWNAEFDMYTTFKTTHLRWVMQRIEELR